MAKDHDQSAQGNKGIYSYIFLFFCIVYNFPNLFSSHENHLLHLISLCFIFLENFVGVSYSIDAETGMTHVYLGK